MPASKSSLHLQSIKDRQSALDEDPSLRAATRRVEKKDWSLIARNSSGSSKPQQRPSLTWPADSEICQGLTAFVMYQVSSKHTDGCWLKKKIPTPAIHKNDKPFVFVFFSFFIPLAPCRCITVIVRNKYTNAADCCDDSVSPECSAEMCKENEMSNMRWRMCLLRLQIRQMETAALLQRFAGEDEKYTKQLQALQQQLGDTYLNDLQSTNYLSEECRSPIIKRVPATPLILYDGGAAAPLHQEQPIILKRRRDNAN